MDNYRVVVTSLADADLDDILDYIAADSPARAISFVTEWQDRAIKTLSVVPMGGARRGSVRFFPFGDYVVVYEVHQEQQTVVVHMISHASRQWQELIKDRL
ncbi:MAG: type II toxin-antitoxin system RelE/ParE family toxin [Rhodobacteraceae bacterium]|nr:type II toxin-antitoxin system RelE/ParE family toxin [Paracoccaceae bacterium]